MKSKALIFGLTTAALVSPAMATKEFYITGATAFRQAAVESIESLFDAGYGCTHDGSTASVVTNSSHATFKGTMNSSTSFGAEEVIVYTSFSGSVEGLRAITSNSPADEPAYIASSAVTLGTVTNGGSTSFTNPADYSFSDVSITSSPFGAVPVFPGANSPVGVVTFAMVTNEGSPVTNVTSKQYRAMLDAGVLQAKLFTGDDADTSWVVASGRNDGSGTRTTYLAETGFGITNLVNQYYVTANSTTENQTWTYTAETPGSSTSSTVWGQDFPGNGGYSSGSALRAVLGRVSAPNATILQFGFPVLDGGGNPITGTIDTVTFISTGDAKTAAGLGAQICSFNGVALSEFAATPASGLGTTDIEKVTEGAYTAWGYQQFYGRDGIDASKQEFHAAIVAGVDTNVLASGAGLPLSFMNVFRAEDGGVVAP